MGEDGGDGQLDVFAGRLRFRLRRDRLRLPSPDTGGTQHSRVRFYVR